MVWKETRLDGPDGHGIYGVHCNNGKEKLVLHVHGLTQHSGCLMEVTSREFFEDNGFDHYSPTLYSIQKDSRKLPESTLSTHIRDVQTVLDHFKKSYKEIFVSAHSLGGLVMMIMNPKDVSAMSLWDPSLDVTNFWESGSYLKPMSERKEYRMDYGSVFAIGEAMVEEIKNYPDSVCRELARKISTPTQFIIPEESIFLASPHTSPESYKDAFDGPFDLQHIAEANHIFSRKGTRQQVFEHTLRFFNAHKRGTNAPV